MTRVVAVTGGAQGIGRAVAYAFAEAGYAVSIADPVADAGEEALAHLQSLNPASLFEKCDTSQAVDVARWIKRTIAEAGLPTVLINNAAINANGPFLDLRADDFDHVLAVNVRGTLLCTQEVGRALVAAQKRGSIINIASTRAFMSEPDTEAYSASKGAIIALTHAMAMSLGPHGIRVNAISPGWIETADWRYSGRAETPHHSEADKAQHPTGRVGRPGDIAEACLFLANADSFITGQNLTVDGGMTKKMIYV